MTLTFAIMGIAISIIGSVINIYIIGAAAFVFFSMLPYANTSIDVLIRSSLERKTQGRVWGLISLLSQLGYVVAYGISGLLADYVFNPLLSEGGGLAHSVGKITGVGEGRGIALMMIICGISMLISSYVIHGNKKIQALEISYLSKK